MSKVTCTELPVLGSMTSSFKLAKYALRSKASPPNKAKAERELIIIININVYVRILKGRFELGRVCASELLQNTKISAMT